MAEFVGGGGCAGVVVVACVGVQLGLLLLQGSSGLLVETLGEVAEVIQRRSLLVFWRPS
jgi:hypothetical protein